MRQPCYAVAVRFGTPDGDQFDLASFGRTIFLLARAADRCRVAHGRVAGTGVWDSGSTHCRSQSAISWSKTSAARSTCLALTSTPANSRSKVLLFTKVTRVAALPAIRRTAGQREVL